MLSECHKIGWEVHRVSVVTASRAVGRAFGAAMAVTLLLIGGCTQTVRESSEVGDQRMRRPTRVISSTPRGDEQTLREAEALSTDVRWDVLEKKGPKPMWEILPGKRSDNGAGAPATGPVAAAPLPVQMIELPDGKVRLIWTLRNYGGSDVTSKRDEKTARRDVVLKPPDLAPLTAVIAQQIGKDGAVTALPRENALVITCDAAHKQTVLELLARLDVPPPQVEITARIFEVTLDRDFQQGSRILAERIATSDTQNLTSTFSTARFLEQIQQPGSGPFQGSVLTLTKALQEQGISIEAAFQLLEETGLMRLVSSPRMTVAVGQTGYMLAGKEVPIQSANINNNQLQTSTQYKPVGVQLYITPQAMGPDSVKLHMISIVSSISGFAPLPTLTGSNDAKFLMNPVIDSREAETVVTVGDGDTLVISGLRMTRTTTRENKIPLLGDVPVLGWAFRNHRSQQQLTDLYFFVTPRLLNQPEMN